MAIIYSYPTTPPLGTDLLIGTRTSSAKNPTRNFSVNQLANYIIDNIGGTTLTVPIFFDVTDPLTGLTQTTLVDSILTQDANPAGTTITVAGRMNVTGELDVDAGLRDSAGSTGTQGQVLSSTGAATTLWIPAVGGTTGIYPFTTRTTLTITHAGQWGPYPSVTVVTTPQQVVVIGDVTYNSTTQLTLDFSAGFAGIAYLN
jgi:hypothetical protein